MINERDTIFALSSGRPPAAIAVTAFPARAQGRHCRPSLGGCRRRAATLVRVRDPARAEVIDEGLALWFPAPNSETGEDVAELQIHGGRAVIAATLAALGKLPGLRPAEAAEFTRRAFENGCIDLPAVEGLADLVAAETEAQRRQAYQHLRGLLGERAETWRQRLIQALALVEAGIDFSDEDDVPKAAMAQALALVAPLAEEIGEGWHRGRGAVAGGPEGRHCRPADAGKSTRSTGLPAGRRQSFRPFPGPRAMCWSCISTSAATP